MSFDSRSTPPVPPDEFKLHTLPLVPLLEFLGMCTVDDLFNLKTADEAAYPIIQEYLERKLHNTQYELILTEKMSEIRLRSTKPPNLDPVFRWSFIERKERDHDSFDSDTGKCSHFIENSDTARPAITRLLECLDVYPLPLKFIILQADTFLRDDLLKLVAEKLVEVKLSENLRVVGHGQTSEACSTILGKMIVKNEISVSNFYPEEHFDIQKASRPMSLTMWLNTATPERIIECAAIDSVIYLDEFAHADVDELIRLWMNGNCTRITNLTLLVNAYEEVDNHRWFQGLHYRRDQVWMLFDGFHFDSDINRSNREQMFKYIGIDFHRPDGSVATVFYSKTSNYQKFEMIMAEVSIGALGGAVEAGTQTLGDVSRESFTSVRVFIVDHVHRRRRYTLEGLPHLRLNGWKNLNECAGRKLVKRFFNVLY
ncbi:unnamed protein product [Caenorhabditis sp. 36 PRJEB53466]|nr:unnamed protein product [Caenorhabditis sp. 36 PRJEB53466]